MKKAVTAMFAPGFGQRPRLPKFGSSINDTKTKGKCWGCGMLGHKKGDPSCKAEAGTVHNSAPGRAKRKFNGSVGKQNDGGPTGKKPTGCVDFLAKMAPVDSGLIANSSTVKEKKSRQRKYDLLRGIRNLLTPSRQRSQNKSMTLNMMRSRNWFVVF
jgi:hypothetical protein